MLPKLLPQFKVPFDAISLLDCFGNSQFKSVSVVLFSTTVQSKKKLTFLYLNKLVRILINTPHPPLILERLSFFNSNKCRSTVAQ